jgi:hypothetical protein
MGNAIGISPPVMINRIVDRMDVPQDAQLAKVALLRAKLAIAVQQETAQSAMTSPDGKGTAPVVDSGAVVDRLI